MQVSPNLFFLLKDGEVIAWDYKNHQQFALTQEYFQRLLLWSQDQKQDITAIDQDLAAGRLLVPEAPLPESWGWDILSQIYHIGTKDLGGHLAKLTPAQWTEQYLEHCKEIAADPVALLTHKEGVPLPLPLPDFNLFEGKTFLDVLKQRKTCRSFNGGPVDLNALSTLLFTSMGPLHGEWSDLKENNLSTLGIRKAFPSGGGLHPEEGYIVALEVEGLEKGVYHYRFDEHQLTLIKQGDFEDKLVELLCGQYYLKGIAFGIFLSARFDKTWWKYPHSRGYRVVLLDIGHASQTVLLTATALGLNTWLTAAFNDTGVDEFLGIETPCEASLFFIGIGHGDNASLNPEMLRLLNNAPPLSPTD